MYKKNIALGVMFLILTWVPLPAFAIELKTAAQESAPKYYKSEKSLMCGLCVDIIHAIENVDSEIRFNGHQEFLPFKRLLNRLEHGRLDIFLGLRETTTRRDRFNFLNIPLYQLSYVLASRMDDKIKINTFDDVRSLGADGTILTVLGSAASGFLHKQKGLMVDDGARSPSLLLEMLLYKRGRFAFYHDLGLQKIIENEDLGDEIRIIPVSFLTYCHYAAFSKNVPGITIDKVKNALEKLKGSGELSKIYGQYYIPK